MTIHVLPLGAGQDVGRSCIIISIGGKNIMFDCGMHMGYKDSRRFPDFTCITKNGKSLEQVLDCVIISHFHLDHCGALPYFSEMCGYDGPIYMTHPTKAICPILLEDFRKVQVDRKGDKNFFTSQMIQDCMAKVIPVSLHEVVHVDKDIEIKAYYAGHVLGAAMFYVRVGQESVVYTGDYNMTPDRHLGPARIDHLKPDLLITETTYATTVRDSKRSRERDFLHKVHECVSKGGKVLIPVFALGRAQELCILIETYWERNNLEVPIFFSAGMTQKANLYYKLFVEWTNQKIKETFTTRNMFDFKHISAFQKHMADNPGPMVLFATPGMLHAGLSLKVFGKWCEDPKNLVILPGYCVQGTVGHRLLCGQKGKMEIDKKTVVNVRCDVSYLSFSAHADAKGIMQLIKTAEPSNVMLVHGEGKKMKFLKTKIEDQLGIPVFMPPNHRPMSVATTHRLPIDVSVGIMNKKRKLHQTKVNNESKRLLESMDQDQDKDDDDQELSLNPKPSLSHQRKKLKVTHVDRETTVHGVLIAQQGKPLRFMDHQEALSELNLKSQMIDFKLDGSFGENFLSSLSSSSSSSNPPSITESIATLAGNLSRGSQVSIVTDNTVIVRSIQITVDQSNKSFQATWEAKDDILAQEIISKF